jgi:hypothetical protein
LGRVSLFKSSGEQRAEAGGHSNVWFATEAKVAKAFEDHLDSLEALHARATRLSKLLNEAAEVGLGDGGLSAHLRRLTADLLKGKNELQRARVAISMGEANWRSAVPVVEAARKAIRALGRHLASVEAEAADALPRANRDLARG